MALQEADISHYETDGYAFPNRAMSEKQARRYREQLEDMEGASADGMATTRGYGNIAISFIDEITRLESILDPVSEILGPDLLVWGANLFIKDPGTADFVSWHQDLTYWGLDDIAEVSAWVALTPANVGNGCMRFIPGSHQLNVVEHRDTFAEQNMLSRGQEIAIDIDETRAVDVVLHPGEFSLHHGRMFHASGANTSTERRIGLAIRYISPQMSQIGGLATMARLVRGVDRYGHFELAPAPREVLEPNDVQRMLRAESLQARYTFDGANQTGKRRV